MANEKTKKNYFDDIFADTNSLDGTKIPDTLSLANINAEVDTALNTAIPASNTADSVNDVLLDQLKPRLPGSGTISTLTQANILSDATAFAGADVATIKNSVGTWTTDARATVDCPASTETDLVAEQTVTTPTDVHAEVDLTNLTANATINYYLDGGAAGTTLTKVDDQKDWLVADARDIVPVEFTALSNYKITITTGAEGANRDVYVRHSKKVTA